MSTELIIAEIPNPLETFSTENGLDKIIDKITADAKSIDRDISTPSGRDNIRSIAFKLAQTKTKLYELGTKVKADAQLIVNAVNKENGRAWDRMESLQIEIRAPLTEWENKEKKRVMQHEAAIKSLELQAGWHDMPDPTAADIRVRLEQVEKSPVDGWEEFEPRALSMRDSVINSLKDRLQKQEKSEHDQAELARLKKEEADRIESARIQKIADDARKQAEEAAQRAAQELAAETAKKELEAAEREKKAISDAAEEKARADKAESDAKLAVIKAEADRISAEAQAKLDAISAAAVATQNERDRVAKEEADKKAADDIRAADTAHKAKINNEALTAIVGLTCSMGVTMDSLKGILTAIAQGKIPHVSIKY